MFYQRVTPGGVALFLCLPNLGDLALGAAGSPWPDLVHGRQDQVSRAVNPVLKPWVFINDEIV